MSEDADGEVLHVRGPLRGQLEELDVAALHPVDEDCGRGLPDRLPPAHPVHLPAWPTRLGSSQGYRMRRSPMLEGTNTFLRDSGAPGSRWLLRDAVPAPALPHLRALGGEEGSTSPRAACRWEEQTPPPPARRCLSTSISTCTGGKTLGAPLKQRPLWGDRAMLTWRSSDPCSKRGKPLRAVSETGTCRVTPKCF